MSNKLSRNSKCPCGSGQKYKYCCLRKGIKFERSGEAHADNKEEDILSSFFRKYSSIDTALTISAAALDPANHGKEVRLDYLVYQALKYGSAEYSRVDVKRLRDFVTKQYPSCGLEDPPDSLFTENIVSSLGNTTVYNGNFINGGFVVSHLVRAIDYSGGDLPQGFVELTSASYRLMLALSNIVASRVNQAPNHFGGYYESDTPIFFPENLDKLKDSLFFSQERIKSLMEELNVSSEVFDAFLSRPENLEGNITLGDQKNPLYLRPLVAVERWFFLTSPGSILSALTHFIWSKANHLECLTALAQLYHTEVWNTVNVSLFKMGLLPERIPEDWERPDFTSPIGLFRADIDKIVIAVLLPDIGTSYDETHMGHFAPEGIMKEAASGAQQLLKVVEEKLPSNDVAIIYIPSGIGRMLSASHDRTAGIEAMISPRDLFAISNSEDHEQLSFWYFLEAWNLLQSTTKLQPLASVTDFYNQYRELKSFYFGDGERPESIFLITGTLEVVRDAIINTDERAAHKLIPEHPDPVILTVKKEGNVIPRYFSTDLLKRGLSFFLVGYPVDLWICSKRLSEDMGSAKKTFWQFSEAICYWMWVVQSELKKDLSVITRSTISIDFDLEEISLFMDEDTRLSPSPEISDIVKFQVTPESVLMVISGKVSGALTSADNSAEREILRLLLMAIGQLITENGSVNTLSSGRVATIVDSSLPLGKKKMIIASYTFDNYALNPIGIRAKVRYLQESRKQIQLDKQLSYLNDSARPPIGPVKEKRELAANLSRAFVNPLKELISPYDTKALLSYLMANYDSLLHKAAVIQLQLPSRLACFEGIEDTVSSLLKEVNRSDSTSLTTRCLIEFVAAEQKKEGKKEVSIQVVDDALAMMSLIILWGSTGDQVFHKLFDIELSILESGRIGTNTEQIAESFFRLYKGAKLTGFMEQTNEDYPNYFGEIEPASAKPVPANLNKAFAEETGIPLDKLGGLMLSLAEYSLSKNELLTEMKKEDILQLFLTNLESSITKEEIFSGLDLLTLTCRGEAMSKPPGFEYADILPWGFNRRLSYLQRPIIAWETDNDPLLMWTPRHLARAWEFLNSLLLSDRYKSIEGGPLHSILSKKAKSRAATVILGFIEWIKNEDNIIVDTDVWIKPKGKLKHTEDIGDCDVLLIDQSRQVVFSIECKRTHPAGNTQEMVNEVKTFFGGKSEKGYFSKHIRRDKWLKNNLEKVGQVYKVNTTGYKVISLFLTFQPLSIQFMTTRKTPLPLLSLPELKRKTYDEFCEWLIK